MQLEHRNDHRRERPRPENHWGREEQPAAVHVRRVFPQEQPIEDNPAELNQGLEERRENMTWNGAWRPVVVWNGAVRRWREILVREYRL